MATKSPGRCSLEKRQYSKNYKTTKKVMRKKYVSPHTVVYELKMSQHLMAGSVTENTSSAGEMNSGSFGARQMNSFWDDEEDY